MKRKDFESKHGKLPMNATYIDLDAQPKQPPEVVTSGWTDTQIKGKPLTEIDAMINSGTLGLKSLEKTIAEERKRLDGLRRIRDRKLEIGD